MITKRLASAVAAASISALSFGGLGVSLFFSAAPAQAADYCQCVDYVKRRFGITSAVGNAKDMIYSLPNLGFRQVSSPQNGAIVIMQPSFPGADKKYGHVGIVDTLRTSGSQVFVSVRSANQAGNRFSEFNCNDVSVWSPGTPVNGRSDVSFWIRGGGGGTTTTSPNTGIIRVNFSGWVMSTTGTNLRNSPHLSDRSSQNVAYRQTLSFDAWTYGDTVTDLQLGTPDARWYKLAGQNYWVPSAYISGNAPNSKPMR